MMTPERCVDVWLSRRPDGSLRYPRTVRTHLELIRELAPWALSEEDINQLKGHAER